MSNTTPSQFETWLEVEVSQKNIARYLASKEQLSIFQIMLMVHWSVVGLLGVTV